MKETIAVWFSCGAASAVAAKKTLEKYGDSHIVRVINNPVVEEDWDNHRFLKDVEAWLGVKIETTINDKYPACSAAEVWNKRNFMSGPHGAPCTVELKKRARQQWERDNKAHWHVLGFTVEEKKRHERFVLSERDNVIPVLIDAGLTKQNCLDILLASDIDPPRMYKLGYPNANCVGCVKATSPTYWNLVRKQHPKVFLARAYASKRLGAKLVRVNGERIQLLDLDPEAKGAPLKTLDFECGIFCEEREFK